MSIPYVSIDQFPSLSTGAVINGGAWLGTLSANDARYSTSTGGPSCSDVPHCLYMWANYRAAYDTYTTKYETNISIPISRYGNANQLSFNWSYKIGWGCSLLSGGYSLTSYSRVGTSDANSYSNDFPSTDWTTLSTSTNWGTTIAHSGTTPIQRNAGSSLGFIYISIDLSMPHPSNSTVSYYLKEVTFDITTPTSAATVAPGGATTATSSGSAVSSLNRTSTSSLSTSSTPVSLSSILGGPSGDSPEQASSTAAAIGSTGNTTTASSNDTHTRKSDLTPAIVGATLGAIALLGLVGFLLFLKRRTARRHHPDQTTSEKEEDEHGPPTMTNRSESLLLTDRAPVRGTTRLANGNSRSDASTSAYLPTEGGFIPAEESDDVVLPSNSHGNRSMMFHSHVTEDEVVNIQPSSPARTEATEYPQDGRSVAGTEAPPPYRGSVGTQITLGPSRTHHNAILPLPPIPIGAQTLEEFARVHREEVSEELERKLARANYLPSDDPDAISEEAWAREYAVGARELAVLRRLYHRNNDM